MHSAEIVLSLDVFEYVLFFHSSNAARDPVPVDGSLVGKCSLSMWLCPCCGNVEDIWIQWCGQLSCWCINIQKKPKDNTISAESITISTLSHYHFILLFTISSRVHYCSVLIHVLCSPNRLDIELLLLLMFF